MIGDAVGFGLADFAAKKRGIELTPELLAQSEAICYERHREPSDPFQLCSGSAEVRADQFRAVAYALALLQSQSGKVAEIRRVDELQQRDRQHSSLIRPGSREAGISLWAHDITETDITKGLKAYRSYHDLPSFVLLFGAVGCGKTFAAVGFVARWALKLNTARGSTMNARFVTHNEFADSLGATVQAKELRETLLNKQWLIFDDLRGEAQGLSEPFKKAFQELIDHRYSYGKKTVITGNISSAEFKKSYGDMVYSRVKSSCLLIESNSADLRQARS